MIVELSKIVELEDCAYVAVELQMLTEKIFSNSLDLCLQYFRAYFALGILEFRPSFRNSVKQFATIYFLYHSFRAFDDIPI